MCQRMCSSSSNKHPLSRARKSQVLLSLISWPCTFAAVFTTEASAQSLVQLIAVTISSTMPVFMLSRYRKSGSRSCSTLEIYVDGLMGLFFLGIYISGIVLLAIRDVSEWAYIHDYKLAQGIPQVYSNLSCIFLSMLYLRSFVQGSFLKYIRPMLKARNINYTVCPACDRSVDAPTTRNQDVTVTPAGQEAPPVLIDSLRSLYNDDIEAQPLLSENSLGESKQTSGVVANN